VELGSGQEIAVNRRTASQIAKLCLSAHGAGYSLEQVPKEEIRQLDFHVKESVGAYRISDGQVTILLSFVDWRDGGNYYVVAADLLGSPLVEIHEISADRRLLTWRYKPSKRDDRNADRRRYFEEHFGELIARISVPKRKVRYWRFLTRSSCLLRSEDSPTHSSTTNRRMKEHFQRGGYSSGVISRENAVAH
jgi:hypothetical protein